MKHSDEEGRQEIIIVRRGGHDDHDEHHGGVWKIAFADFMTAMMCFFLVMWLVNAANEQTRAAVASYFNPVKLIDRNTNRKGIDDIGEGPQTASTTDDRVEHNTTDHPIGIRRALSGPAREENASDISEVMQRSDKDLFADPYAVLAEIVQETGNLQNVSSRGDGGAQDSGPASGASGGESYRDPFAPDFWTTQLRQTDTDGDTAEPNVPETLASSGEPAGQEEDPFAFVAPPPAPEPEPVSAEAPDPVQSPVPADTIAREPAQPDAASRNEELAGRIREELERAFGGAAGLEGISVVAAETGVVISVADDLEAGMFEIGSAVPRRDLVLAMERIGRTLAEHQGNVTINGHTDGRPFSSGDYDNWRLSTARAHATYYMLIRGGLDEKRVSGVAGFADRRLKVPEDPYASANRRIEILLELAG